MSQMFNNFYGNWKFIPKYLVISFFSGTFYGLYLYGSFPSTIPCPFFRSGCDFYNSASLLAMQSAVLATAISSVCLSVTYWCPIQTNEDRITRSSLSVSKNILVFWHQQWLGSTSPSTSNLRSKWPTLSEKRRLLPISAYNVSTIRASKKSSVIANRKSTRRFPTSCRWSPYVTPNSPQDGSNSEFVV